MGEIPASLLSQKEFLLPSFFPLYKMLFDQEILHNLILMAIYERWNEVKVSDAAKRIGVSKNLQVGVLMNWNI